MRKILLLSILLAALSLSCLLPPGDSEPQVPVLEFDPNYGDYQIIKGVVDHYYIHIGNQDYEEIRDRLHIYFRDGLEISGYGNCDYLEITSLTKGIQYSVNYRQMRHPRWGDVIIQILGLSPVAFTVEVYNGRRS